MPFNNRSRSPPYPSHLLCFISRCYFASARDAYKSLACRNLCTITSLLLCPDTGRAVRLLGNIGALQKYQFRD